MIDNLLDQFGHKRCQKKLEIMSRPIPFGSETSLPLFSLHVTHTLSLPFFLITQQVKITY